VSGLLLIALFGVKWTPVGRAIRQNDLMRFGLEGPPRLVQLVQVDAMPSRVDVLRDVGHVVTRSTHIGSGDAQDKARGRVSPTARHPGVEGLGDARHDLVQRAIASRGAVPIFQSDELVIETLVRPEYPEEARDRGVEGHVAVLALVDTLGRVSEAEVMDASGEPSLDAASRRAVMRCKFRPYRIGGEAKEVYAVFRFAFRIY
jgi:TonB family protein